VKAKSKRKASRPSSKAKAPKKASRAPKQSRRASRPRAAPRQAKKAKARPKAAAARWVKFVEKHGVVLASAKGPVPSVAEAVAGEPIVGSWWAHKKGKAIFAALCEIDDSPDVRCFKLVDGKITFVHRKTWPALVRLGHEGVLATAQLASVQQEHLPTGEHRNIVTPFPDWVDEATEKARSQLSWIDGR
jgi:hypothetical protein